MKIYNYHKESGELISEVDADESPLEPGVFLIPANATTIQPLSVTSGYVAVFNGTAWEQKIDNRGVIYYLPDNSQHVIVDIDVEPPIDSSPNPFTLSIEEQRAQVWCYSWQLKRALTQSGLRASVEAVIAAADQNTKDMWDSAQTFKRLHHMIVAIIPVIGITDAQADDVFTFANNIIE